MEFFGSDERRQSGEETGSKMGTESNRNFYHHIGSLVSVLSAFLYLHLHYYLVQSLQLHIYSLGKRYSSPTDLSQFRSEPVCVCLAI